MDELNLLRQPLFTIRGTETLVEEVSLPALLARLEVDGVEGFVYLAAHQQHALYAFLVQVAAIALLRADERKAGSARRWEELLLALSDQKAGVWSLVQENMKEAAFLQSPSLIENLVDYKNILETPDQLDILVTSKNHDVKAARMATARPEQWVYALLSLQTLQGFSGRGNYGVSRMNGGFGNRPVVSRIPSLRWGQRWKRDVGLLIDTHEEVAVTFGYADQGLALVWLAPWNGADSLATNQLDPWYIEICRRVRLEWGPNGLRARMMATTAARVRGNSVTGNTGDPWTPVKVGGKADAPELTALTIGGAGIRYKLLHELVMGRGYEPSLCMRPDACPWLWVATLVRGQGSTEGYHERLLPIPPHVEPYLANPTKKRDLAKISEGRIENVEQAKNKALRPAIKALLAAGDSGQGGPRMDSRPDRWIHRFEDEVDRFYFEKLWGSLGIPAAESQAAWWSFLKDTAGKVLEQAIGELPMPSVRRYRAISAATSILHGSFANLQKLEKS